MRAADAAECRATGYDDLELAVRESVDSSAYSHAVRVNGVLVLICGVAPLGTLLSSTGIPWALGTDDVHRYRRTLTRMTRAYIAMMLGHYPILRNVVHADNVRSIAWLRRAGFIIGEPFSAANGVFRPFSMGV